MDDIGTLFPDTDAKYKDISSILLLEEVVKIINQKGYSIVNVDTTVILQSPKLASYKHKIRESMARILGIEYDNFTIKAKTAEHILGELGSSDAIECQSVALVCRK